MFNTLTAVRVLNIDVAWYAQMMTEDQKKYWLGFSLMPQIGAKRGRRLLNLFGDFEKAWSADSGALAQSGIEPHIVTDIITQRTTLDLEKEMEKVARHDICLVTIEDDEYPEQLKNIYDPPLLLFTRGDFDPRDSDAVGIVGSRRASEYGRQIATSFARDLALSGVTIVSGLASGIDGCAHRGALSVQNGRTIAILGCGIDDVTIYPREHIKLAHEIIAGRGVVMSEFPLGTPPLKQHFPSRNRIISGLARGILVVEAAEGSGSLITATSALEQGREVFAVPGSIYGKNAVGTNALIKQGAQLVTNPAEILDALNMAHATNHQEARGIVADSKLEQDILDLLAVEELHIDELVMKLQIPVAELSATLIGMEMKGMVRDGGGGKYGAGKR